MGVQGRVHFVNKLMFKLRDLNILYVSDSDSGNDSSRRSDIRRIVKPDG